MSLDHSSTSIIRLEGKLDDILAALAVKAFKSVAFDYGVAVETIKRFLNLNGIDPAQYSAVPKRGRKYHWRPFPRPESEKPTPATNNRRGGKRLLDSDLLPEIQAALEHSSFPAVGALYRVSSQTIINFLIRHGVDHKKFNKRPGPPRGFGASPVNGETETTAPAVLPSSGALKALEDEAYESAEHLPAEPPPNSKNGTMQYAPVYRPDVLREWPLHTDFRPDDLNVRD